MTQGGAETSTRWSKGEPVRFGCGELMLAAMVNAHGVDACFSADEAVVVQLVVALVTRTYGKDNLREREVGEALVRDGHGRA